MKTSSKIKELISQGENNGVEFKSADVRPESIAKEIVAFANASGGSILIGIEDDGRITGLNSTKNYEEWIMNIASQSVNPLIELDYTEHELDAKKIGLVEVPKGKDKPYQTSDNKFLIRVGSTNRIASVNELMRLFQQSGVFHYDSTGVEKSAPSALNFFSLSEYFNNYKINFENLSESEKVSILQNTDILTEDKRATVAGMLLFGINPQKYLPMASVSFAHFQSDDLDSKLFNKKVIEGTLSDQIDKTVGLIKNSIPEPSDIKGTKRENQSIGYPEKVFRELVVNACCHRNYSITGSSIRVFIFSNRLEVISPGELPNTVTIEKLKSGVSYAVNPVIVKFMENMNYIDKLGRGLPMVWQEAQKLGKELIFEETGEEFKVTLEL